ncbi:MAG: hypothetical protein AAF483_03255 [Planctomycetota bacterium]
MHQENSVGPGIGEALGAVVRFCLHLVVWVVFPAIVLPWVMQSKVERYEEFGLELSQLDLFRLGIGYNAKALLILLAPIVLVLTGAFEALVLFLASADARRKIFRLDWIFLGVCLAIALLMTLV